MDADVDGGIVINKRFEKTFKSEEELTEDFYQFVRRYLSMAQGLNIGNIVSVADNLKYALSHQLGSYAPGRRSFYGTYNSNENIRESACEINHKYRTNMYMFSLTGQVIRCERYLLWGKISAFYKAELNWTVASIHANTEVGRNFVRKKYNQIMCSDEGVSNALGALLQDAQNDAICYYG